MFCEKNLHEHIGRRINVGRALRGITQEALADCTGLELGEIEAIEKGSKVIGLEQLWMISTVFKVPMTYFFTELVEVDTSYTMH